MTERLETERLVLRPWTVDDAASALDAYGHAEVARWLAPAMDRVPDEAGMRLVLQQWAAELRDGGLIGGATLLPLPPDDEFEVGWQLRPDVWGQGYATETGLALAR